MIGSKFGIGILIIRGESGVRFKIVFAIKCNKITKIGDPPRFSGNPKYPP
jgi:hypothetical protein